MTKSSMAMGHANSALGTPAIISQVVRHWLHLGDANSPNRQHAQVT